MDLAENRTAGVQSVAKPAAGRMKFIIGGVLILAAIVYLIWTSASANAQYFMTIDELNAKGSEVVGRQLRVSGAVIGDSIVYDSKNLMLEFEVAHTPGNQSEVDAQGGMAQVLHDAVMDPNRSRIKVVYSGVMPDLLKNEAQAIMTGRLGEDGVFHAEELLLKCPTRYEEAVPEQSQGSK
ncbi:MAG: cytochrome c maturation protein CcmE [Anaerolineae bacterium]|nr:cytochrome c maturation protein CcmE [Anaerolineae bacterium]